MSDTSVRSRLSDESYPFPSRHVTADSPIDSDSPRQTPSWRLAAALSVVLLAVAFYRPWNNQPTEPSETPAPAGDSQVFLSQQRPGVAVVEIAIPYATGMTVLSATLSATRSAGEKRQAWTSRWRGEREMALLEALGEIDSEGADGLNWQFEVNGTYADRGAGAFPLAPGDRVLWKLAPYE